MDSIGHEFTRVHAIFKYTVYCLHAVFAKQLVVPPPQYAQACSLKDPQTTWGAVIPALVAKNNSHSLSNSNQKELKCHKGNGRRVNVVILIKIGLIIS